MHFSAKSEQIHSHTTTIAPKKGVSKSSLLYFDAHPGLSSKSTRYMRIRQLLRILTGKQYLKQVYLGENNGASRPY